jgi:hypothetical protein
MTSKKVVFRTSRGSPIAGPPSTESTTDGETTDAEVTDQVDQADPPAVYGDSPRAKERWARLVAYFKSPIKASAASTKGEQHTSALRDHASDVPADYDTLLAKVRNKRGDK